MTARSRSRAHPPAKPRSPEPKRRPQPSRPQPAPLTARTADRHVLYQRAVQAPEADARFYDRWFQRYAGRPLRVLREDFCGTAVLACHHVKRHRDNRALGVDLHWPTLAWGRIHNVRPLLDDEQRTRLTLLQQNVLDVRRPLADAILALNFSYSVFKQRAQLLAYLKNCHRSLRKGGVLFLDAWGGPDVLQRKTDAFVYEWRLWTLAELRELFAEAGFAKIDVLWEGTDHKTGGGNGVFRKTVRGGMDEAWIAIVVGQKQA
jgi:SAM-dependent methyltransferase